MPLIADFEVTQGTDCTQCTLTDTTDYTSENVPAQRTKYIDIIPDTPATGKTNVAVGFTSGATILTVDVTILGTDTQIQVSTKIRDALNGNATVAALVTAALDGNNCRVTADTDDLNFNITDNASEPTDLGFTTEVFPFSTRTVVVDYPDGSTTTTNFPYVNGTGDTFTISSLTQDFALVITMTIVPQIEDEDSVYSLTQYKVLTCNTDACFNEKASNLEPDLCNVSCSDALLCSMTKITEYKEAAYGKAAVGDQTSAQTFLDAILAICTSNCTTC